MRKQLVRGITKQYTTSLPSDLEAVRARIEGYARDFGLDFYDVIFEVLDWNQLNEVAAYGGFPNRYPHWRFGMEYEELSKSYSWGLSKIYEMVINTDPCYAYLLYSNSLVDQKLVMAHVYAHCDFFKNNLFFAHTSRKMMDEMANHKTRVMRYIDKYGQDKVEDFIDSCLALENLIDYHAFAIKRRRTLVEDEGPRRPVRKLRADRQYMDKYINPKDFMEDQKKSVEDDMKREKLFPEDPEKDVLLFLMEYAPLEPWERDVLSIIREESYYFAPQGQTKIMNEGWACVVPNTLVFTDHGILAASEIVDCRMRLMIHDGESPREVIDHAEFKGKNTVKITTKRGYELEGSTTHQVLMGDRTSWKRLSEIAPGDLVTLSGNAGLWPEKYVSLEWMQGKKKILGDVADEAGCGIWTVIRHPAGMVQSRSASAINSAMALHESDGLCLSMMQNACMEINIPSVLDERLALFMGYLTADGHISTVKKTIGLTSDDADQIKHFCRLSKDLFGITPSVKKDGNRLRASMSSENLGGFLVYLGLETGQAAGLKNIPSLVMRSPKKVMASFLKGLYDSDGHAGPSGIVLSTSSFEMAKTVQIVLLNFGIVATRKNQQKDIWQIRITGLSARRFRDEIGFTLERKAKKLDSYLSDRKWFKKEEVADAVMTVEHGRSDVCDFTVNVSHRYAAGGFINHNSFWHSKIMTEKALEASEVIDYADHHSGTVAMGPGRINPYKIGLELFRDIENRWNKGRFGKEYNECDDMAAKKNWDLKLGLGRQKIFEIRKLYNDIMFIDEFLTPEFCRRHKLFVYAYNSSSDQYEIASREFQKIKKQFLFQLTNFGQPIINVVDGNFKNRGELLLKHTHEGVDLKHSYACETLKRLHNIWRRPVAIETKYDGVAKILICDGVDVREEHA